jgi:valine--pyruvate aminotransferase
LYERLKARGALIVPGEYFFYGLDEKLDEKPHSAAGNHASWSHASQCVRMTFSQSHDVIDAGVSIMADELRCVHAKRLAPNSV